MKVRALRGATTCDVDTLEQIDGRTQTLVTAMLERNGVDHEDLVSIVFTATDDLHAQFPATAARAAELGAVAEVAPSVADAVAGADVVIVAVPVGRIAGLVVEALDAGAPAVTDVGSVKLAVLDAVRAERPDAAARYVGGHPMAG